MTTFDERERAFENQFVHGEDLTFRAHARRNVKLGLWAARQLGKSGDDAAEYAQALVSAEIEGCGDESVLAKLRRDLKLGGIVQTDQQLREEMAHMLAESRHEILQS